MVEGRGSIDIKETFMVPCSGFKSFNFKNKGISTALKNPSFFVDGPPILFLKVFKK